MLFLGVGTTDSFKFLPCTFLYFPKQIHSTLAIRKKVKILKRTKAEVSEKTWSKGEPGQERGGVVIYKKPSPSGQVFQDPGRC